MFGKKAPPPIKSLIAQGSRIEGNLRFTDGLRVDGECFGNISANAEQPSKLLAALCGSTTQCSLLIRSAVACYPFSQRAYW